LIVHDVLDPRDLVPDEADQLASSGYAGGAALSDEARQAAAAGDLERLSEVERALARLDRDEDWPYDEPTDEAALRAIAATAARVEVVPGELEDRLRGAWLGRAVGNTLGKPVEGLTRLEVETYLRAAGDWPQTGYLPLIDPLPAGVPRLHPSAPTATSGRFTDVPRDDDIDWTILNLMLLERHGRELTTDQILAGWLDRMPFTQTYTAERAAYRNAIQGLAPPATATHRNPYREWIGALIRGDVFGYVCPGDPGAAARLALVDARLSHVANGLYGEMWAAALVAAAFETHDPAVALQRSLAVVPPRSRLAKVFADVLTLHQEGRDHVAALDWVDTELDGYPWVHTLNNAALIAIALLWGRTFMEATAISVSGGRDTDSTTATVGSVYGALHGAGSIPEALVGTTHVHVRSAVREFDRITIDELASRTMRLVSLP
jgi:ADP-ribosylglycohydrolase